MPPSVALFRAADDAEATARTLAARGIAAVRAPVLEFAAVPAALPSGVFAAAVATSARAIVCASPEVLAAARDLPWRVVGARTAEAARAAGLTLAAAPDADVAELLADPPPGRVLYLAGRDRKPDLESALAGRVEVAVVYAAQPRDAWSEAEIRALGAAGAALHYSARSAALALRLAQAAGLATTLRRWPHVCLSRDAARPLADAGAPRALWPRRPTEADLIDTLESALADGP